MFKINAVFICFVEFYPGSVVISISSCGWPKKLNMFFEIRFTCRSTPNCAFGLISFMEYDVVFPFILVQFFTPVFEAGGSSVAVNVSHLLEIALFVQGFVVLSPPHCLLVGRKIVLQPRHSRKMRLLQWVLFGYLPRFWDVPSPWVWVPLWRKSQPQCWLNRRCVLFWSWSPTHNHIHCKVPVALLSLGINVWQICYLSEKIVGFVVSHSLRANSRKTV